MPSTTALANAQTVRRQPSGRQGGGENDGREHERQTESDEDAEGPPSTPGGRCAKHERNDRQGARREDRQHPGHEREAEDDQHVNAGLDEP